MIEAEAGEGDAFEDFGSEVVFLTRAVFVSDKCAQKHVSTVTQSLQNRYDLPTPASSCTDSRIITALERTRPPAAAKANGAHGALRRGKVGAEFCVQSVLQHRELDPVFRLVRVDEVRSAVDVLRDNACMVGLNLRKV